jgi:hypothetical protein
MTRPWLLATPLVGALALAACDQAPAEPQTVKVPLGQPKAAAGTGATAGAQPGASGATPMKDRVAVIGLLNKRNNVTESIEIKPGEGREIGPVIIRVSACERTAPWEMPQETGAFVQVDIRERGEQRHRRVFSGWLFRESPSLNVVEHPVYDVWVKDCTMRFPGEEGPASPATKPAASATPAAAATPSPTPSPAAVPAPAAPAR